MQPTGNIVSKAIRMHSIELLNLYPSAIDPPPRVKPAHQNLRGPRCIAIHASFDTAVANVGAFSARAAARALVLGRTEHGTAPIEAAGAYAALWPPGIAPPDIAPPDIGPPDIGPLGIADQSPHAFTVSACPQAFGHSVRPIHSPFARVAR
jgi:hypothetical protein